MNLIDKTEIAKHREVSRSVRDDKINPHIEDAQLLDLKPLLGDSLYDHVINNLTDTNVLNVLNPHTYTYNGNQYQHQGFKKVLSLFSYTRYIIHGSFTDTGFGMVQKSNQDSSPVPEAQKRNIYTKDRQAAIAYFNEISLFMNRFPSLYATWKSGSTSRKSSFRISKITR